MFFFFLPRREHFQLDLLDMNPAFSETSWEAGLSGPGGMDISMDFHLGTQMTVGPDAWWWTWLDSFPLLILVETTPNMVFYVNVRDILWYSPWYQPWYPHFTWFLTPHRLVSALHFQVKRLGDECSGRNFHRRLEGGWWMWWMRSWRGWLAYVVIHMAMDQYLLIPFLVGWTSINPSYFGVHQGYRVLTHPHICTTLCSMYVYHICTNTHGMIRNKTSMVQKCNIYHSRRYTQNFQYSIYEPGPSTSFEGGNPWKSLMNELIVLGTSKAQQSCQPFFDEALLMFFMYHMGVS